MTNPLGMGDPVTQKKVLEYSESNATTTNNVMQRQQIKKEENPTHWPRLRSSSSLYALQQEQRIQSAVTHHDKFHSSCEVQLGAKAKTLPSLTPHIKSSSIHSNIHNENSKFGQQATGPESSPFAKPLKALTWQK